MPETQQKTHGQRYGRRWRKLRLLVLAREPFCRMCRDMGRVTLATVVDHVKPLSSGGTNDPSNLQPLCKLCHDAVKHSEEMTGRQRGCDVRGVPLDAAHPWRDPGGG